MKRILWAAAAALALPSLSAAHEAYWVKNDDGRYLIAWGHPGDPPGRYGVEEVLRATLFDVDGNLIDAQRIEEDGQVLLDAPLNVEVGMASFTFNPGDTIQTAEGRYTSGSKADHSGYRRAFHSVRFGKALYGWSANFAEPLGAELEWVALGDPFSTSGEISFRLLYESEPLPEAAVTVSTLSREDSLSTDDNGEISVTLPQSGGVMISARHSIAIDSNTVDERALNAVLSFTR